MQGMRAVLVMNKCDLGEEAAQQARRDYAGAELPVLCVSAGTGAGVEQLRAQMQEIGYEVAVGRGDYTDGRTKQ